jgi:hypothetical protein
LQQLSPQQLLEFPLQQSLPQHEFCETLLLFAQHDEVDLVLSI